MIVEPPRVAQEAQGLEFRQGFVFLCRRSREMRGVASGSFFSGAQCGFSTLVRCVLCCCVAGLLFCYADFLASRSVPLVAVAWSPIMR